MDLPKIGDPETNRQDFKVKYPDDETRASKMVSDVVAFANANGGKLFIGIADKDDRVAAVPGLKPRDAKQTRTDIERFVKDLVQPIPVVNLAEVKLADGNVVVVVEVQPYPGTAVGCRAAGGAEGPWSFPVRVATQTKFYPPERLVLLMDVTQRRKLQMLFLAKESGAICVKQTKTWGYPNANPQAFDVDEAFFIDEIDEVGGSILLAARKAELSASEWVPLDSIHAVWRNGGHWNLWLTGSVTVTLKEGITPYFGFALTPSMASHG